MSFVVPGTIFIFQFYKRSSLKVNAVDGIAIPTAFNSIKDLHLSAVPTEDGALKVVFQFYKRSSERNLTLLDLFAGIGFQFYKRSSN